MVIRSVVEYLKFLISLEYLITFSNSQEIISAGEDHMLEMYHKHWEQYNIGAGYLNQLYGFVDIVYFP